MARRSTPWFWKARKAWYVTIDGKRHRLAGNDKEAAYDEFHGLMAGRMPEAPRPPDANGNTGALLFEKFLEWCQRHRAHRTYTRYKDFIQSLVSFLQDPVSMPVESLRPFHVVEWLDTQRQWNATTKRNAIIHVQRPFNWACKLGYVDRNPVRGVEEPQALRREETMSLADF